MNIELLQRKMNAYFATVNPDEMIAEFESMGVVLEDILDDVVDVKYEHISGQPSFLDDFAIEWLDKMMVKPINQFGEVLAMPEVLVPNPLVAAGVSTSSPLANQSNCQFAMAA